MTTTSNFSQENLQCMMIYLKNMVSLFKTGNLGVGKAMLRPMSFPWDEIVSQFAL